MHRTKRLIVATGSCRVCLAVLYAPACAAITIACTAACGCHRRYSWNAARGEIVSADSRQVYRGLDIGAAKVTPEEQALVPHHLLDVADVREVFTVSQFQKQAIAAINNILTRGHQPFLVGGSPHYIQAVVDNLDIPHIEPQPELRAQLEKRPLPELLAQLEELDPQSASTIDRNNPRRVIRALEVCLILGK